MPRCLRAPRRCSSGGASCRRQSGPGPISDTSLYKDAKDPGTNYTCPAIASAKKSCRGRSSTGSRSRPRGTSSIFVVGLEKFPAPEIALEARDAKELPGTEIQVVLTHRLFLNEARDRGQGTSVLEGRDGVASGVEAVLMLPTLEDRDELYRALTESSYGANLEVRRKVEAAGPGAPARWRRLYGVHPAPCN